MKALITLVMTLLSLGAAQNNVCGDGFELVGTSCYMIPDPMLSWPSAMDYCKNLPLSDGKTAALARVETCSQLHALWDFIFDGGYPIVDYWLGGTIKLDMEYFRWDSTGEKVPMGVPFWFPGQPDFIPKDEMMSLSLSKNGYFADEGEHLLQRFVCQLL